MDTFKAAKIEIYGPFSRDDLGRGMGAYREA